MPQIARQTPLLNVACVLAVLGIWIENGPGMIVPARQGAVVEYLPSWSETVVCIGIWAFGALLFTWMIHIAVPILTSKFHTKLAQIHGIHRPAKPSKTIALAQN